MPKARKYGARRSTTRRRSTARRTSYKTKRRSYSRIGRVPRGPASVPFLQSAISVLLMLTTHTD